MDNYLEKEKSEWALYDSIVQSYRSNMIASQSLLLAVAAIFFSKEPFLVVVLCAIGLVLQWYIWFRIITKRCIISDYHKFNFQFELSKKINNEGNAMQEGDVPLSEQTYVSNRNVRKMANAWIVELTHNEKYKRNARITRVKLDYILPILFSIVWVLILSLAIKDLVSR